MSTIPLLGPTPISVGGATFNPALDACFTCTPPYQHPRVWIPDGPTDRTLVLCFDGTGDSFDQDVSQACYLSSRSCPRLNATSTEFKRRSIPGDAEERRSHEAARVLPGDSSRPTCKPRRPHLPSRQAGIGTYTSSVLKTPIIEGTSKLLDQMIAYNLPDHIKGLSFPPRVPPLTMPDQSSQTAISF